MCLRRHPNMTREKFQDYWKNNHGPLFMKNSNGCKYSVLISDPRLSWVDAFSFGDNGYLYAVVNQLHRSAVVNGGDSATKPPYLIVKFGPLSGGTGGR